MTPFDAVCHSKAIEVADGTGLPDSHKSVSMPPSEANERRFTATDESWGE
jgi:hypothetical protein